MTSGTQNPTVLCSREVSPSKSEKAREPFQLTDAEMEAMRGIDRVTGGHDPEAPGLGEMLMKNYPVHD